MVKIKENNIDYYATTISNPEYELVRDIIKLKQRMSSIEDGLKLNDYVKYETATKIERNPTIDKKNLSGFTREVAEMLDFNTFMEYQINAWQHINAYFNHETNNNLIVDAGTGFGKTESVIPAIIKKVMDNNSLVILIFPSHALLIDQIQRIMEYKINKNPRIGIQIAGINSTINFTIYNSEEQRNTYIRNFNYKISKIDPLVHTNYHFETNMFNVDYNNPNIDKITINLFKCKCGGSFENFASFTSDGSSQKHKAFVSMNNNSNSYWKCNKCDKIIYTSFSRDEHINIKPNILLTTIDSILSLIADPEMGNYIKDKLEAIVFDEVHSYNSSYGGHATAIISKIKEIRKSNILLAGLSATIDMPEEFGRKLFKSGIKVIAPTENDIVERLADEKYIFIKSGVKEKGDDVYPLKTQSMIQTIVLISSTINKKMMAFMDSVDAVISLSQQTEDAYNSKKLYEFRLDDLLNRKFHYVGLTCNGPSNNCQLNCSIYTMGECWDILRRSTGATTPQKINIKQIYAESLIPRAELQNSRTIFSTSELQLGIDIPDIEYLVQYGTPYTIFDYIQRKGRAGRSIGSKPIFLFILGNSSNDYIYFSYGASILNKKYILPLEEKNDVIKNLYDQLFEYYTESSRQYESIKSDYKGREYIAKFKASWLALFNGSGLDGDFTNFLKDKFQATALDISNINQYSDMRKFKDDSLNETRSLINKMKDKLKQILEPSGGRLPSQDLQFEIHKIIEGLNKIPGVRQNDIAALENFKGKIIADIENNKASSGNELLLYNKINEIVNNYNLFSSPTLGNDLIGLQGKLHQHSVAGSADITKIQQEARKLFFTIQCLYELEKVFKRSLTSEVIKYVLRANYFYTIPSLSQNINKSLPVMPSINLFSNSSKEIALNSNSSYMNNKKNINIRDSVFKYFPFRRNATKLPDHKIMLNPRIYVKEGKFYFSPEDFLDPLIFTYSKNKRAKMPLSISVDIIRDDGVNGIISYCKECMTFYDYSERKCKTCNRELAKISLYVDRQINTDIDMDGGKNVINRVSVSDTSKVTTLLESVKLSITYQFWDRNDSRYHPIKNKDNAPFKVEAESPYGFKITTTSLKIEINSKTLENIYNNFKTKYVNRIGQNNGFKITDVLHTLAHVWLKTIAIKVGVSPDQFSYKYTEETPSVIISELQEGGAGYLKAFIEYLKSRTKDVYSIMKSIAVCEEHESINQNSEKKRIYEELQNIDLTKISVSKHPKIIGEIKSNNPSISDDPDDYPVCYDGCLYCIGLTSCSYGGDEQFDHLSLSVALDYINSLVTETDSKKESASLFANGGIIIDRDGEKYSIFSL